MVGWLDGWSCLSMIGCCVVGDIIHLQSGCCSEHILVDPFSRVRQIGVVSVPNRGVGGRVDRSRTECSDCRRTKCPTNCPPAKAFGAAAETLPLLLRESPDYHVQQVSV